MVNIPVLIVGIVMLGIGFLFIAPVIGFSILPFALPVIGPVLMGIPAMALGLLGLGVILMIAGFMMY